MVNDDDPFQCLMTKNIIIPTNLLSVSDTLQGVDKDANEFRDCASELSSSKWQFKARHLGSLQYRSSHHTSVNTHASSSSKRFHYATQPSSLSGHGPARSCK